jgi:hypothetical protein
MTKAKNTGDSIDGLLQAMARGHSPKGPITTEMRVVPLSAIHKMAGLQFRDGLSEQTLDWLRGMLGVGEEPEEDDEGKVDLYSDGDLRLTPPVTLVEVALQRDEGGAVLAVRPLAEKSEDDDLGYIPADGWHRIQVHEERWEQRRRLADAVGIDADELEPPKIRAEVIKGTKDPVHVAREVNIRLNIKPRPQCPRASAAGPSTP